VRRFPLALMGLVILVSACTTRPENVEARYVSPNDYSKWTCPQLYDERARVTSEVERVSGLQRDNANGDAVMLTVGVVVFWPVLLGMAATHDRSEELGRLKGVYEAVDSEVKIQHCTIAPPPG